MAACRATVMQLEQLVVMLLPPVSSFLATPRVVSVLVSLPASVKDVTAAVQVIHDPSVRTIFHS